MKRESGGRVAWGFLVLALLCAGVAGAQNLISGGSTASSSVTLTPLTGTGITFTGTEGDGGTAVSPCAGAGARGQVCASGAAGTRLTIDAGLSLIGDLVASNVSGTNTGDDACAGAGQAGNLCVAGAAGTQLTVDAGIAITVATGGTAIQTVTGAKTCLGTTGAGCLSYDGTGVSVVSGVITGTSTTPRISLNGSGVTLANSTSNIVMDSTATTLTMGGTDSSVRFLVRIDSQNSLVTPGASMLTIHNQADKSFIDMNGFFSSATGHPVGIGATTGGSRNLRRYQTQTVADTTFAGDGLPTATLGTGQTATAQAALTGATRMYIQSACLNVNGSACGIVGPYTTTRQLYRPRLSSIVVTDSAVTTRRVWVALTSADLTAVVVPTTAVAQGASYVGLAFDTAISANWGCCSGDATNHSCSDTGIAVATGTEYRLSADWTTSGTLRCCVNNTCVNKTTNLSAAASNLGIQNSATTLANAVINHDIAVIALEQN